MERVTVWTIGLGLCLLASSASAQPRQNAKEAVDNAREVRQDRRQLVNDVADVRWLEEQIRALDRAHDRRDRREEDRIRQKIRTFLRKETAETRHEVAQDRREAAKSAQEVRSERREVGRAEIVRPEGAVGAAEPSPSYRPRRKSSRFRRDCPAFWRTLEGTSFSAHRSPSETS